MVTSYKWMDSTLQELSNDTKNTKFGVQLKKLYKLQVIEAIRCGEPKEQQMKPWVHRSEGRAAQQHIHPILAIFKDLYKGGHVLGLKGGHVLGLKDGPKMTKTALWGWSSDLLREKTLPKVSPLLFFTWD